MNIQNQQVDADARQAEKALLQEDERESWSLFSAAYLAKAYGMNEPEYSVDNLRP